MRTAPARAIPRIARAATLAALLLPIACGDLKVPGDAVITCDEGGAECPDGFTCHHKVGRCVPVDDLDLDPPALIAASVQISGSPARAGGAITLSFEVDEPLAEGSGAALVLGEAGAADLVFRSEGSVGLRYAYSLPVHGNEPEGRFPIALTLIDRWRNSTTESLDPAALDFTQPAVTDLTRESDDRLREGALAAVTFSVSEPLAAPPRVLLGGRAMDRDPAVPAPRQRYTATVVKADGEGEADLTIQIDDPAGNSARLDRPGYFNFDFTPPAILSALLTPSHIRPGKSVQVQMTFSEALAAPPVVRADPPLDFEYQGESANTHSFLHEASDADAEGEHMLFVSAEDEAGNRFDDLELVPVVIDLNPPAIADFRLDPPSGTRLGEGDEVRLSIDVDEAVGLSPLGLVARIGDLPMLRAAEPEAGWDHSFSFTVTGGAGENFETVSVELADRAGYRTVQTLGSLLLDYLKPTLIDSRATPALAGRGATVFYDVTPSEPLASPPVLEVSGSGGASITYFTPVPGTAYKLSHAVAESEHDAYTVRILLTDEAGNESTLLDGAGFGVDAIAPTVERLSTNDTLFSGEDGRNTVQVSFDCSESLDADGASLAVKLGDEPMSCGEFSQASPNYTCRAVVGGAPGEGGPRQITVATHDAAGNADFTSIGVTLDFTPPALVGTPVLDRCDGLASARIAPNELWARRDGYGCAYTHDPTSCGETGAAVDAPLQLAFAASEPLTLGAGLSIRVAGGGNWTVDRCRSTTTSVVALYSPQGSEAEAGALPAPGSAVQAAVLDMAGNPATLDLGELRFDFTRPAAPDTETIGAIVYTRVPWGSEATEGVKTFTLQGQAGAVEPGATVVVLDGPDPDSAAEIGRAAADAAGAFGGSLGTDEQFDLNRADRPQVFVVALDAAGNRSDADPGAAGDQSALVRDVAWVATLGQKKPGSLFENPSTLEVTGRLGTTREQDPAVTEEPGSVAPLQRREGASLSHTARGIWQAVASADLPQPAGRFSHQMVFDTAGGRALLHGGAALTGGLAEVWEWSRGSARWVDRTDESAARPAAVLGHASTFDSGRGRLIVFGGLGPAGVNDQRDETWEWNPRTGLWRDRTDESVTRPQPRARPALTYDSRRERLLLYGGTIGLDSCVNDTWVWDPQTGGWTESAMASPPGPELGCGGALAYDPLRDRAVATLRALGPIQVWELDPQAQQWRNRSAESSIAPWPEGGYAIAWAPDIDRLLMVGARGTELQTWLWDPQSGEWLERTAQSATQPEARSDFGLAYDPVQGEALLFGGQDGNLRGDTWAWDASSEQWEERTPVTAAGPAASVWGHAAALDSSRDALVVVGGFDVDTLDYRDETWTWSPSINAWTERTADSAVHPDLFDYPALAYDSNRDRIYLQLATPSIAGPEPELWEWAPQTGEWTDRSAESAERSSGAALAWDSHRLRMVMFGGSGYEDIAGGANGLGSDRLWEWNPADGQAVERTDESALRPDARFGHALAYDSLRQRVVLFGGHTGADRLDDTWEWEPASGQWSDRSSESAIRPSARSGHVMAFDEARGRILLFGGTTGEDELWEFDPASGRWTDRSAEAQTRPSARSEHVAAFDPARNALIVFSGGRLVPAGDAAWEWFTPASARPGAIWSVPFGSAGAASPAFETLTLGARAGGRGYSGPPDAPVAADGAELRMWAHGHGAWQVGPGNTAAPDAPADLTLQVTDPAAISALLSGPDRRINIAITPRRDSGSGPEPGTIAVDYLELTVRYREDAAGGGG